MATLVQQATSCLSDFGQIYERFSKKLHVHQYSRSSIGIYCSRLARISLFFGSRMDIPLSRREFYSLFRLAVRASGIRKRVCKANERVIAEIDEVVYLQVSQGERSGLKDKSEYMKEVLDEKKEGAQEAKTLITWMI